MVVRALIFWCFSIGIVRCQIDLDQHFQTCTMGSPEFDDCLKDKFNELTPYFKTGLPEYGVGSFDPFHAETVSQKMNTPILSYKLQLRNVSESGWSSAKVTKVKTDLSKSQIAITQFFPDKRLNGWYEIEGTLLGNKFQNEGPWNLALFGYVQTLTIRRKPSDSSFLAPNPSITVKCNLQSCNNLKLHIGNLARGRSLIENVLDRIINTAWRPGFLVLRPLINDLVSSAFTKIMDDYFRNFPFDMVFKNEV